MPIIRDYCYERLFVTAVSTCSIHRKTRTDSDMIFCRYSSHGVVFLPVVPERIGTAQIIFSMPVPVFMII